MTEDNFDLNKYIEAIQEMISVLKQSAFLCGAPLVALITQLKWLHQLDSPFLQFLISFAVACFLICGCICAYFIELGRNYIVKLKIQQAYENQAESHLLAYIDSIYSNSFGELSEENLTNKARLLTVPLGCVLFIGWFTTIVIIYMAIWAL